MSENLAAPIWAEPIVRALSRIAYMMRMPVMIVTAPITPYEGAHAKSTDFYYAWTSFADAPDDMPRIVLAHNPDSAEHAAPGTRVDLMCSGHTHGGQVWVPGLGTPITPSAYGQKYAGGLCQGPHCPVLVSRGVGMAIMPVRFGVPPEIGEITLKRIA